MSFMYARIGRPSASDPPIFSPGWRIPPGLNEAEEPAEDATEVDPYTHLWLHEITTTTPKALRDNSSLRAHHCDNRRTRINGLHRLKAIYSDDTNRPGFWLVANTDGRFANIPIEGAAADITQPQWLDDDHPHLGFTPAYGGNEGFMLSVIRIPDAAIPLLIVAVPGAKYRLEPEVTGVWRRREELLVQVSEMMSEYLDHLPALRRPPLPGTIPYADEFPSFSLACETITRARDAFSSLTTHLSFLFSMWRFSSLRYPFSNLRRWILVHKRDLVVDVDDLVRNSNVGDFRIGTRAGYLVDLFQSGSQWIPYLHVWAEAGVPLWIYVGDKPKVRTCALDAGDPLTPAILDWVPMDKNFELAYDKYQHNLARGIADANPYHFASYDEFKLKLNDVLPPSEIYTQLSSVRDGVIVQQLSLFGFRDGDYRPGMMPGEYFDIRKDAVARWMEESGHKQYGKFVDSASWNSELRRVEACVWELERGAWSRRKVDETLRQVYFELFSPAQRWWDPLMQTLELCSWLEPSGPSLNLCVFKKASSTPLVSPAALDRPASAPSPMQEGNWEEDDWDMDNSEGGAPAVQPQGEHFSPPTALDVKLDTRSLPSLRTILKDRLGYDLTRPLPPFHTDPQALRGIPTSATLARALMALGVSQARLPPLSPVEKEAVLDAVGTLMFVGTLLPDESLVPKEARPLRHHFQYGQSQLPSRWDISLLRPPQERPQLRSELEAFGFTFSDWSGTVVHRVVLGISNQPIPKQYWVLIVDPATLTQISRANLFEVRRIARYLIQQGIAFQIAVAVKLKSPPIPRSIGRQGVGSFTTDEPFTVQHYQAYKQKMNEFLASRRGALALRCGGVVWRLAIESVNSRRVQDALQAPTKSSLKMGEICGSAFHHDLVTDQLEPHELDLILGAHRYQSRNPAVPQHWNRESIATVWPTRSAWARSSFNTGEWSQVSEEWFQRHRRNLEDGVAQPMSAGKWKTELRKQKETKLVWKHYETLVIEGYLPPS